MRDHCDRSRPASSSFFAPAASPVEAQTTYATITGTVTDSTGGVIKGATVVATNVETSVTTKTVTNDDGVYTGPQLREGPYTLSITAPGLREFLAVDIVLVTRDIRHIDATLQVGALESAVQVSGANAPIELETQRISDVRTADQLRTLPLNDPGVWSVLAVTPSLSMRGGGYSFAGSRGNQSMFAIDGTSMTDGVGENVIGPLANYTESFKEVKIDMASNSAESPSLGQVTIVSKSGTNRFSGVVFDYYQSPMFRAANPFSGRRPAGVIHFPGLAVGGPVVIPELLRRPRPDVLVRVRGNGQRQQSVDGSEPDGSARAVEEWRLLGARTADPQPIHRRGLQRRADPGGGAESGRPANPGALLPAAEHREHRDARGEQLPRDGAERSIEAVLRHRAGGP